MGDHTKRDVYIYQKETYIYEDRQADFERHMHLYDDSSYYLGPLRYRIIGDHTKRDVHIYKKRPTSTKTDMLTLYVTCICLMTHPTHPTN